MAPEIVSELVSTGPRTAGTGGNARPIISQTVQSGSLTRATVKSEDSGSGGNTIENTVRAGGGRVLSESTRKLIAELDKPSPPPAAAGAADAGAAPTAAPPAGVPPVAATVAPVAGAPAATTPSAAPAAAAPEHERIAARNRELVAEVERLKAGPRREPSKREKALDEIERGYLDNPVEAIRKLQALALGHDDHKHADIDAEMKGLYQDLTSRELGVTTDTSQQALRETARTKALFVRDQRERKAEQEAASAPPESSGDKQAAEHAELIGGQLKSIGTRYPLTMSLAQEFHGLKPEALLLKVIRNGFATGEFDPNEHDDKLIEAAAKKTEALYQDLADKFGAARPSTATPIPAAETANKEGQGQGARSITNATASVAPATPPAKAETAPKQKYRNEDERRKAIVRGHVPD